MIAYTFCISQKWSLPKQIVNTLLKDLIEKGYIELFTTKDDKRNKLLKLTSNGKIYASEIIEALHEKEMFALNKMGLNNVTNISSY